MAQNGGLYGFTPQATLLFFPTMRITGSRKEEKKKSSSTTRCFKVSSDVE